jgi:hypothetical protein
MTDIKADNDELELLYTLIEKHKKRSTKMSAHESHKDIAEIFRKGRFAGGNHDVINIDFHSDCYATDDSEVHCGNWGKLLSEQCVIDKLYWIGRGDSDDTESDTVTDTYCGIQTLLDSPAVLSDGIDHIFICRSAVWSPPHLDDNFINMVINIGNMLDAGNIKGLYKLVKRWDGQTMANIGMLAGQIRGIFADKLLRIN